MKFDLSKPCQNCPFRTDIKGYLRPERIAEITDSVLAGEFFGCHKSTILVPDPNDEGCEDRGIGEDTQECAGAAIFAAKHGRSSQISRIVERIGGKVAELDMSQPVVSSRAEMLRVHRKGQKRGKR